MDSGDFDLLPLPLLAALSGIEFKRGAEDNKLGMRRGDFELEVVLLAIAPELAVAVAVVLATACARQDRIRARGNIGEECCAVVMRNVKWECVERVLILLWVEA